MPVTTDFKMIMPQDLGKDTQSSDPGHQDSFTLFLGANNSTPSMGATFWLPNDLYNEEPSSPIGYDPIEDNDANSATYIERPESILAFRVYFPTWPVSFDYQVEINQRQVIKGHADRGKEENADYRTVHEVLSGGRFKFKPTGPILQQGKNTVKFSIVSSGYGTVIFSDVVLWFKRGQPDRTDG